MRILVASCVLVLLCHCGGGKEGSSFNATPHPDGGGADGGVDSGGTCLGSGHGPPSSPPAGSRPSAPTCTRTPNPNAGPDAAPPMSCNTDPDCNGGALSGPLHCAEHVCGDDQCLVDADCPWNQLCVCNDMAGGGWRLGNECVAAGCHTDADCGSGNYCIPSRGYCGGVGGYYCTSSRDTCVDPTKDCAACGGNACVYSPIVGHFTCAANSCAG